LILYSGNRILIARYRPAQEFVIERSLCTPIRLIQINEQNYQQS